MNFSPLQLAIFEFVVKGLGNLIIEAVAGSGKTTTIAEAYRRVAAGISQVFLAFNKSIASELASRGLNARTFHSLCYGPMLKYWGVKVVNENKVRDIIESNLTPPQHRMYARFVQKLVGLAKNAGIGCLVEDTEQNWSDLASHHDLELESEDADYATAIRLSQKILAISNNTRALDFDDLLYLAVKEGVSLPKFQFVWVDEGQDTNAIQIAIIRKIMTDDARLAVVGDPHQAIYGFRGAESDALDKIESEFGATRLPLSVSYRCPRSVVRHAQQWVPHIQHHDQAEAGVVEERGMQWKAKQFVANDLVLCRATAPLINMAYRLLTARVPVMIRGKDIGLGLKSLIKRMNAKGIDALVGKLDIWATREIEKAKAKKMDQKAESIKDKHDCVIS